MDAAAALNVLKIVRRALNPQFARFVFELDVYVRLKLDRIWIPQPTLDNHSLESDLKRWEEEGGRSS